MLALPQRRQHLSLHSQSTLPSPPSSQHLSFDQLSQQLSAQNFFDQKLLHDYLESQQHAFATPIIVDSDLSSNSNPFMNGAYDFLNPTIRIQQSTPTPQLPSGFSQPSMLPASNATASGLENWHNFANNGHADSQSLQTPVQSQAGRGHQRASSSSSIGSTGSQYQSAGPTTTYPYVAHPENLPSCSATHVESSYTADIPSRPFSNHLPTPTHTPTQDSFAMNPNFNTYNPNTTNMDSTMSAHFSMKQALMDQHVPDEDVPSFGHSARHSVSSYGHDSPATPHTAQGEDFEDRFKVPPTGEILYKVEAWFDEYLTYDDEPDLRHQVPKFERTYTDVAPDSFYNSSTMLQQAPSIPHTKPAPNASLLSPYRSNNPNDILQRTVQAAQNARSQSPASSASRPISPFRHSSPYRHPSNNFSSPRMRVPTAALAREQKVEADAAYAMKQNVASTEEAQPKTISPKDALLDYREADDQSKVALFPEGGASEYEHQYNGGDQYRNATQSSFDTTSGQAYRRDSWATPHFSPNYSSTTSGPPASTFAFVPPAISGNMHGLPFTSQFRTTPASMPSASDQPPEFPAHLTSMESSASEAGPETASTSSEHLQKPAASSADSGTYTCTYHGCTLRFETPQKLQKHKREGHRNANAATMGSSMTSAALLERNSQAGPHKCERINPTTGKPCNTIFSRPYDLTRHEDTIHNARKQKVRCALCVEEKTFSRNDALTRHMRVVHPEIDFPGKHRRRGGNHD
ncbi:uncharacterized protein BDR25DRAFT_327638 [Lindgomyces ingoldianus]|uniref:Uncharacterized protein n=1 Tax=Lindgomyces ingoldianus TaxID=673940 RepID=A0ACB6QJ48_9PLEO|nr:uncharacterized protein BDR25DRAFT_327638 [Lindgomyces ingoldianus]KAF2466974.1 hypothetical protein BDR25DRAFT_327638 [Lindgomyces ingoldianus]